MKSLTIEEMQYLQRELKEAKGWKDDDPSFAKDHMLNMIEEIGECASIFKKKGIDMCMTDPLVRQQLVTELADMQMYFMEVLIRLQITPEEFSRAYLTKHKEIMGRDFDAKWRHDIADTRESMDSELKKGGQSHNGKDEEPGGR